MPSRHSQAFPSTRWSRILAAPGERDLEQLARGYWTPIRAWLQARLRLRPEAAEDLAQEAFAWMLATGFLDRADPARGRFRAFLKTALHRFAIERHRSATAQRRGGGAVPAALDDVPEPPDPGSPAPDAALDEAWRRELLLRARDRLQQELEGSGRARYFALFRDWYLDDRDDGALDHNALAARHGVTRTDVSNWLDHAKRRYRAILHDLVRDTVGCEETLQEELRWLFGPTPSAEATP
ncbi:MAG: RNA polymerase sigma factor [Planctomycetota bacterium]